jgi:hypothetical protein
MKRMVGVTATSLLVATTLAARPSEAQGLRYASGPTVAAIALAPTPPPPPPPPSQRCQADPLTPAQAEARLQWARRCALIVNVGNPAAWFDTFVAAPGGGNFKDYVEYVSSLNPTGRNGYLASSRGFEINGTFISMLYNSAQTSQYFDSHGFYQWEGPVSRKKQRPMYPSYGTHYDSSAGTQLFPHPLHQNNCFFYSDKEGYSRITPSAFYVAAVCESTP